MRFAVLNDLHHAGAECDAWFTGVVEAVAAENPDFCVLLGDLANAGLESSLRAVRDHFSRLECPVYPIPGNHDCDVSGDTSLYAAVFPGRLNYTFRHGNAQFIALDTTEGTLYKDTRVSGETLDWLAGAVKALDPGQSTMLFSHFPLANPIPMTPLNADRLWSLLRALPVRAAFCGHFHGQDAVLRDPLVLTNVCCSRVRDNHDGDPRKGFWMVEWEGAAGQIRYHLIRLPV